MASYGTRVAAWASLAGPTGQGKLSLRSGGLEGFFFLWGGGCFWDLLSCLLCLLDGIGMFWIVVCRCFWCLFDGL